MEIYQTPKKVFIFGNLAGGKTRFARLLAKKTGQPLLHLDSIQFDRNLELLPREQIKASLDQFQQQEAWIIDGFGPFEWIEKRMSDADLVVFVEMPLWRHRWWLVKRLLGLIFTSRSELPKASSELRVAHIKMAWHQMNAIHTKMNPQLRKILNRPEFSGRVIHIRQPKDFAKALESIR